MKMVEKSDKSIKSLLTSMHSEAGLPQVGWVYFVIEASKALEKPIGKIRHDEKSKMPKDKRKQKVISDRKLPYPK